MSTVSECIKPRYEKERKYGVSAYLNIIQGFMGKKSMFSPILLFVEVGDDDDNPYGSNENEVIINKNNKSGVFSSSPDFSEDIDFEIGGD